MWLSSRLLQVKPVLSLNAGGWITCLCDTPLQTHKNKCFSAVIGHVLKAVKVPKADKPCHWESSTEDKNTAREEGWAPHRQCSLNVLVLTGVHSFPWTGWFLHWNLLGRERPKGKEACASMDAEEQTIQQLWSFPCITLMFPCIIHPLLCNV